MIYFPGPDLPMGSYDHSLVKLNNDLIVLGGYNNGRQKSIFQLSSQNGTFSWTTLEQELDTCKHSFVAIVVPDNYFACEEEVGLPFDCTESDPKHLGHGWGWCME